MRSASLGATVVLLAGCASTTFDSGPEWQPDAGSAVVVVDGSRGPRKVKGVPPGHYPPPGQCRLWFEGRPPGHQPPPTSCEALLGHVASGSFILYNDQAWDAEYDWRHLERNSSGSVPRIILQLTTGGS